MTVINNIARLIQFHPSSSIVPQSLHHNSLTFSFILSLSTYSSVNRRNTKAGHVTPATKDSCFCGRFIFYTAAARSFR
ncbi:hypothetical protein BRARA_E02156 [Brassica rapa]|uniref:Uncharacterized protein n=1 Tax=Brassica campestris TaxID=3711 RepID=A0A397ZII2_BRACM|nr:hypothetical protein BRARA_E02156 [Brassica rapa]